MNRNFATLAANALRTALEDVEMSHDACAAWLGVSRQLVTRWCNPNDELTIDFKRGAELPPAVRISMCRWLADIDNANVVERVDVHDDGESLHELALDLICAASEVTQHSAAVRNIVSVDQAVLGENLCRNVERAAGRLGLRYRQIVEARGQVVRAPLAKVRPSEEQREEKCA